MGTEGSYSLPKATGSKCDHLLTCTAAVGNAWDQTFPSFYVLNLLCKIEYVKIDIYVPY